MPITKESIAECSKLLWDYAKKTFPQGAINCQGKKETPEAYSVRFHTQISMYTDELDQNDAALIKKHCPQYRSLSRAALVEHVNNELPKQVAYRTDKIIFAKNLAEKYQSGVCGEMIRVLQDYAVNNENAPQLLKEHSYAHIQLCNPFNRADTYHEILVIGLDNVGLQAFLNKQFDQCGDAIVLDYWSKDRYFVKQLPQKLEDFYKKFENNIANGFDTKQYSLHCYWYSESAQLTKTASLQQAAVFFNADQSQDSLKNTTPSVASKTA